jgi:hypothetical protein
MSTTIFSRETQNPTHLLAGMRREERSMWRECRVFPPEKILLTAAADNCGAGLIKKPVLQPGRRASR